MFLIYNYKIQPKLEGNQSPEHLFLESPFQVIRSLFFFITFVLYYEKEILLLIILTVLCYRTGYCTTASS